MVGHYAKQAEAEFQFPRQRGLRHCGHANYVGPGRGKKLYLRAALKPGAVYAQVRALGLKPGVLFAPGPKQCAPQLRAERLGKINVHDLVAFVKTSVPRALRHVYHLVRHHNVAWHQTLRDTARGVNGYDPGRPQFLKPPEVCAVVDRSGGDAVRCAVPGQKRDLYAHQLAHHVGGRGLPKRSLNGMLPQPAKPWHLVQSAASNYPQRRHDIILAQRNPYA